MSLAFPSHLSIKNGHLMTGMHDLVDLAAQYRTPLFVTNEDQILSNYESFASALSSYYPRTRLLLQQKRMETLPFSGHLQDSAPVRMSSLPENLNSPSAQA